MTPALFLVFASVAGAYILYLRLQLYINQRILRAFQASTIVVPPTKKASDPRLGLLAIGLILLALGVIAGLVK
ncbi:MAG: hypothetical protein HY023_05235 [Chloroflexi bacterium]|nr:hypothetical protein [Chloroflexota bacterium]MBI3762191.1 hypothetical protein [Chloroflexota bacterium]